MGMKCPKCHFENLDDSKFCKECGTQIISSKDIPLTETLETPIEELTRGTTFADRYEIIEELGKGGMGKVYRVEDTKAKEEIALKLIKPEIAADKKTINRFRNELTTARKIRHKNICGMYDLGEEKGTHYITMEYVPGEDLKSFIRRSGQLAVGTTIRISKQVCEGLSEAHRLGVVHRDLKPSNIMIDKEGNARIMDFGIARSLKEKGITGAGMMVGTPEYMSPEQVEGKEADQRADIYSLGVILYEMVTGRVPFEGETPLSIAVKHKTEPPPDPKELNAQISEDFSRLILKFMEKDKENRYQSAEEILSELNRIEEGIPTSERVVPKKNPLTSKEITVTFGLKKLFIPALVIFAIAIAVVIIWQFLPEKEVVPFPIDKTSIAVLPFEDLSPLKDQEIFCDGMTDEIITKLTRLQGWKVMNRNSVMLYKNKDRDIKEIGQELDVATILLGTVRKEKDDIRVTAQLVNVEDRFQIWSDTYDQKLESVFYIQSDIAEKIVKALKVELTSEEKNGIQKKPTESLEAYNLYLQGRYFWNKRSKEGMKKGIECFQQALVKDPYYALAHVGLADCYKVGGGSYLGISAKDSNLWSKEAVMKALEIDETLAEAHATLAVSLAVDWHWSWAEREFKRAIELKPSYATAHQWYAETLVWMGRHEEAIVQVKRALELDPLSLIANTALGAVFYFTRRYDNATEQLRYTLELDPNFLRAYYWLGLSYVQVAMFEEAIAEFQKAINLSGENPEYLAALGYAYATEGSRDEAEKVLNQLKKLSNLRYVSPHDIAMIYASLHEIEQAFIWLEKAFEERAARTHSLKVDPVFDSLRSDPRFQDLLRRMNFPE